MDGRAAPEARYERREGVELAFVAALQHLPPNQRAALILREVLGFSGQEIAEALETTVAAVNSALQRARKAVDERLPDRSQQATLRALGDQRLREIVERYMDAMARGDVDAVVEPAGARTPCGRCPRWAPGIAASTRSPSSWPPRRSTATGTGATCRAHASGQAAVGSYVSDAKDGTYRAFALDVLTLRGDRIADITSFINRTTQLRDGDDFLQLAPLPGRPGAGRRVLRGLRPARPAGLSVSYAARPSARAEARARAAHERPSSRRPRR